MFNVILNRKFYPGKQIPEMKIILSMTTTYIGEIVAFHYGIMYVQYLWYRPVLSIEITLNYLNS